jgi:hypothetical protein
MAKRDFYQVIPTCKYKRCKKSAMPNCSHCIKHWLKVRGWNEKRGEFDEPLPFDAPVSDPTWDAKIEAVKAP